jgi:hypothetical protein
VKKIEDEPVEYGGVLDPRQREPQRIVGPGFLFTKKKGMQLRYAANDILSDITQKAIIGLYAKKGLIDLVDFFSSSKMLMLGHFRLNCSCLEAWGRPRPRDLKNAEA